MPLLMQSQPALKHENQRTIITVKLTLLKFALC